MTLAEELFLRFVDKSGGLAKVDEVLDAIRNIPDAERADFVRRIAARDESARQLLAAALLGFSIASTVAHGVMQ